MYTVRLTGPLTSVPDRTELFGPINLKTGPDHLSNKNRTDFNGPGLIGPIGPKHFIMPQFLTHCHHFMKTMGLHANTISPFRLICYSSFPLVFIALLTLSASKQLAMWDKATHQFVSFSSIFVVGLSLLSICI